MAVSVFKGEEEGQGTQAACRSCKRPSADSQQENEDFFVWNDQDTDFPPELPGNYAALSKP